MTGEVFMNRFTSDYIEARTLLTEGLTGSGYQHDHDQELGMYWYATGPV
jgi:hypothetical protein